MNCAAQNSTCSAGSASAVISRVMPVRFVMNGGMGPSGFTKAWNVATALRSITLIMPISRISDSSGFSPVVSRSSMM